MSVSNVSNLSFSKKICIQQDNGAKPTDIVILEAVRDDKLECWLLSNHALYDYCIYMYTTSASRAIKSGNI